MKIRPLLNRVIVRPIKYQHAVLFVAGVELRKGEVVAVGPGLRVKRRIPWKLPYEVHAEGRAVQPSKTWYVADGPETGAIKPMSVKVGDVVEYGFRDLFEFPWDGEKLLVIREANIYGLTDSRTDDGIFEPKSALID